MFALDEHALAQDLQHLVTVREARELAFDRRHHVAFERGERDRVAAIARPREIQILDVPASELDFTRSPEPLTRIGEEPGRIVGELWIRRTRGSPRDIGCDG